MFKRIFRFSVRLGVLVAIAAIVVKLLEDRETPAPRSAPEEPPKPQVQWVEPQGGVCPTSHPIKAKLTSKVFRKPGGAGYDDSKPDRCYASEDAALADGLREAKR